MATRSANNPPKGTNNCEYPENEANHLKYRIKSTYKERNFYRIEDGLENRQK
jgi:hypothetical protein